MDLVAEVRKISPVTRFLLISLVGVSMPILMNLASVRTIMLAKSLVRDKFQIWRLYTSFFFGRGNIYFIYEVFTLYRTANDIETKHYSKRSADLAWQTFWACVAILIATIPLNGTLFFRSLITCLIYVYSALAPAGSSTSIMGLVTLPMKYYPYITILIDLLMDGTHIAALSAAGACVGHLWWWTVWGGRLGSQGFLAPFSPAPHWLCNWFGETKRSPPSAGGAAAGLARGGIHVTAPRQPLGTGGNGTTAHPWGAGMRLG